MILNPLQAGQSQLDEIVKQLTAPVQAGSMLTEQTLEEAKRVARGIEAFECTKTSAYQRLPLEMFEAIFDAAAPTLQVVSLEYFYGKRLPSLPRCKYFRIFLAPELTEIPSMPEVTTCIIRSLPKLQKVGDLPKCQKFEMYGTPSNCQVSNGCLPKCEEFQRGFFIDNGIPSEVMLSAISSVASLSLANRDSQEMIRSSSNGSNAPLEAVWA